MLVSQVQALDKKKSKLDPWASLYFFTEKKLLSDHNFLLLKEYQCTVRGESLHEKACFFNAKNTDQLLIVHTAYQQFGFSLPGYSTF